MKKWIYKNTVWDLGQMRSSRSYFEKQIMKLPIEYRWLKAHNFEGLTPWYFVEGEISDGLANEYYLETGKEMIPFARRQDNDDIAGFEITEGVVTSKVLTVHLTWTSKLEQEGFPYTRISGDVFSWLIEVVFPETKEWITEAELERINRR